jgi:hypothetical protein
MTFCNSSYGIRIEQMLAEHSGITLVRQRRLESLTFLGTGPDRRIASVTLADASGASPGTVPAIVMRVSCVIDASYEGDLMALAGVPWRVGREGRSEYQESLAPEQPDQQLQAYNFRFIMTRDPSIRVTPTAPPGYRRDDFVDVLAALPSDQINKVFDYPRRCIFKAHQPPLPNGKYDINDVSGGLIRLSLPGVNLGWPDGSWEQRRQIQSEHLRDQAGLLYFLQQDAAVPEALRREAQEWGWCRDEFVETDHLPPQLYVREARRMVGFRVFTQQDCEHAPGDARAVLHPDAIAMGDYGNNCHGTLHEGPRFGGRHTGEFYHPVPPYQIPYGTLIPQEPANLLVPVAASSTHAGFCALRLEPIWMSLGQAAGHAASLALQQGTSVQKIAVPQLQKRLHERGAATIYVTDVLPGQADFQAVQWWGTLGGLHGLAPMPERPGQRGRNLHGQYFEANPGQAAELDQLLDQKTGQRWMTLAMLSGIPEDAVPRWTSPMTRGEFIRAVWSRWQAVGRQTTPVSAYRLHREAVSSVHAPGEVDHLPLVPSVVPDASRLPGIVVDDVDAVLIGTWQYSSHTPPWVGRGYLHDQKSGKGQKSATFTPVLPQSGLYEVRLSHCYNVRRATSTPVTIHHAGGEVTIRINQQDEPPHGRLFRTLGTYRFEAGKSGWVRISSEGTEGLNVIADAVQFIPVSS